MQREKILQRNQKKESIIAAAFASDDDDDDNDVEHDDSSSEWSDCAARAVDQDRSCASAPSSETVISKSLERVSHGVISDGAVAYSMKICDLCDTVHRHLLVTSP